MLLSLPNSFYFCRRGREGFAQPRKEYHHAKNGGKGMKERLVKKEEIEKQLEEMVALLEQVDAKMEKVIHDVIEDRYSQHQKEIGRLEKRIAGIEQRLDGKKTDGRLPLSSTLYGV
ncbi:hypothetical protein B4113_1609 [Geobacillus sp. B4113_201601]|nr:hypothetical protein B4113_1609 [Geobacillus sp. B4113_201601]